MKEHLRATLSHYQSRTETFPGCRRKKNNPETQRNKEEKQNEAEGGWKGHAGSRAGMETYKHESGEEEEVYECRHAAR